LLRPSVNLHDECHGWGLVVVFIAQLACSACQRGEPPSSGASSAAPLAVQASDLPRDAGDAGAREPPPEIQTDAAPADDASASLPQTRDKPATDPAFDARVQALFEGIVHDDPERAMPFFFPVAAYQQVKAIAHPESDWKRRLVANYARDIHALAKELGPDARFVRAEVPRQGRWVEPDEEYNRIGYYRVYGTQIFWTSRDGKEHAARISSMISWRGQWYVVHLTGFK